MNCVFCPPSNEERYRDEKWLRKKFKDRDLSEAMMALWQYIDNAENAHDIQVRIFYNSHLLKGDRGGTYSISPLGKRNRYRLIVVCLDDKGKEATPNDDETRFLLSIKCLEIKELTYHYD